MFRSNTVEGQASCANKRYLFLLLFQMDAPVKLRAVCYNINLTQNDFDKIESVIHRVVIFDDADACVDYVTDLPYPNSVLLIVSDVSRSSSLVTVVSALHDFEHVIGIYVLSESKCTGK